MYDYDISFLYNCRGNNLNIFYDIIDQNIKNFTKSLPMDTLNLYTLHITHHILSLTD